MIQDPVTEIKRIRHELGAAMDYDVHRIFEDLRARQTASSRNYTHKLDRMIADTQFTYRDEKSIPQDNGDASTDP